MNSVCIDVSMGKSTVTVNCMGEEIVSPFDVDHTASELSELAKLLKSLDGEARVVMEATGNYYLPIAATLYNAGIFVCVVNPVLLRGYGNSSLRPGKTDKADARKLAKYGRRAFALCSPGEHQGSAQDLLPAVPAVREDPDHAQNNLIALLDMTFPGANRLFTSPARVDGTEKWIDFVDKFWHCDCVSGISENTFIVKYQKWCSKHGYHFSVDKACGIHRYASACVSVFAKTDTTKFLIWQAVLQLTATSPNLAALKQKMQDLASNLPEYFVVMKKFGSRHISKRGSPAFRRTLFLVMTAILIRSPVHEPVFQFMDKKRSEGKPYKVYMMASANKFLRIYYASVKSFLEFAGNLVFI